MLCTQKMLGLSGETHFYLLGSHLSDSGTQVERQAWKLVTVMKENALTQRLGAVTNFSLLLDQQPPDLEQVIEPRSASKNMETIILISWWDDCEDEMRDHIMFLVPSRCLMSDCCYYHHFLSHSVTGTMHSDLLHLVRKEHLSPDKSYTLEE